MKDPIKHKYRLSNITRFCQIAWWVCMYSNRWIHIYCNFQLSDVKMINFPLETSHCVIQIIDRSLTLSSINCDTMNTNLLNYHNIPRDVPTKAILIYTLCKKAYIFFYQNNTYENAIYSIFCMIQKGLKFKILKNKIYINAKLV